MRLITAAALTFACTAQVAGQEKARTVEVATFESDAEGWVGFKLEGGGVGEDAGSKVAVTHEAAHVKAGKGALAYTYEVAPGEMRVLALQRPFDLSGMKSLRFSVKCSHTTSVIFSLAETGGAGYQASATCAAGAWQEIAVNLDEFLVDEKGKDANGKLDLDEIGALHVFDVGGFLVNLLPELKGSRSLWLDEIRFSSQPAPLTTGPASVTKVVPVFLVDSFESSVIRWASISLEFSDPPKFNVFDAPMAIDAEAPKEGGKQSLRLTYPRRAGKVHGLMRTVEKNDLSRATGLDLWLKTSHDGTYVVGVEEKDNSRYQKTVELKAGDGWKSLSLAFGDLALADDSKDENGKLDPDQIKQVTIADLSSLVGGGEAESVRLWVDQVQFSLAP